MKKYLAEAFGTFVLVFCGTITIVLNVESGGIVTYIDIALSFGLAVMSMVYFFRKVSGAHINPAVTIAAVYDKRLSKKYLLPYIIAQLTGAILASLAVKLIFPYNYYLGVTLPAGSPMVSFAAEFLLTLVLMLTILNTNGRLTGIIIGSVVGFEAFFAGRISGASMNPARSIGPAIVSGHYEHLWLYIVAPIAGAISAVLINKLIWKRKK